MISSVELVWAEQVRFFESQAPPLSVTRLPSPSGMEAIQEVDEDGFSTTKTNAKQQTPTGSAHPPSRLTTKSDITISDFARAQEERDRELDGVFKVITERTEEAETSRLDASQTSIKVARDNLTFTFKKDRLDGETKETLASKSSHQWHGTLKTLHKSEFVVKEPPKPKKSVRAPTLDKSWGVARPSPTAQLFREKSQERQLQSSEKEVLAHSTRSKSNSDTERKHRDTPWKPKSISKRFFKSFRDILQRTGQPGSSLGPRSRQVESIPSLGSGGLPEEVYYRTRLSPDVGNRTADALPKSKSFLRLK